MDLQAYNPIQEVTDGIAANVDSMLRLLGENPEREGLVRTPHRVGKSLQYLTKGYKEDPEAILRSALFEEDYRQEYEGRYEAVCIDITEFAKIKEYDIKM